MGRLLKGSIQQKLLRIYRFSNPEEEDSKIPRQDTSILQALGMSAMPGDLGKN